MAIGAGSSNLTFSAGQQLFIPEVFSKLLQAKFYSASVLPAISNTDYEGEISGQGDKVHIRTVPNVAVADYNGTVSYADLSTSTVELLIDQATLTALPDKLTGRQTTFARTGGLHAAAVFDAEGRLLEVREDVGRHNAVDKLIGAMLRSDNLPLWNRGILTSGRASFEILQKVRMAGCPMVAAVGASSSLAAELAWESDITLVGFLRDRRFNIYTGPARIGPASGD